MARSYDAAKYGKFCLAMYPASLKNATLHGNAGALACTAAAAAV